MQIVAVGAADGVVAGVCPIRNGKDAKNTDFFGQYGIYFAYGLVRLFDFPRRQVEVRYVVPCVDPGVRPTGTGHLYRLAEGDGEGPFEFPLDARHTRLRLPSAER